MTHGNATHGMSKTHVYRIWASMLDRCRNPKSPCYHRYGGRGIAVCERWHSFLNFYADMGDKPEGKSLDRYPDKNGNYELSNCRWAGRIEQQANMRSNLWLTFNGETRIAADWSRITGIPRSSICNRLKRGLTVEEALTFPPVRSIHGYKRVSCAQMREHLKAANTVEKVA